MINGNATDATATIEGATGVYARAGGALTVTNFGLIEGTGGVAVKFLAAGDRLIDEAAARFVGAVAGGGGTLELAAGKGTISGLGTSFIGFGAYVVDAGAAWSLRGTNSLAAGSSLANHGTVTVGNAAMLQAAGALVNSGAIDLVSGAAHADLVIEAAGATLSGGGTITLSGPRSRILGATATAILTNVDNRLLGGGAIGAGSLTLVNQTKGQIIGNSAVALTIDTGANVITNAGTIESAGTGQVVIKSAVANSGTLYAVGGTLTVDGAVSGAGAVDIRAGVLDFSAGFAGTVSFVAGSTGTLELADFKDFTGHVRGLSLTGANAIDLVGFTLTGATATYSGTTAAGVLTVTNGAQTAKISLSGNYTGSTFTVTSDGHGGVIVKDPAGAAVGGRHGRLRSPRRAPPRSRRRRSRSNRRPWRDRLDRAFQRQIRRAPHPSRFAVHPPREGEGGRRL